MVDIFGAWEPLETVSVASLRLSSMPSPLVRGEDILEFNFEWGPDHTLPYEILDAVRLQHGIDVTGLNMSLTRRGNAYRSYALLRGTVS